MDELHPRVSFTMTAADYAAAAKFKQHTLNGRLLQRQRIWMAFFYALLCVAFIGVSLWLKDYFLLLPLCGAIALSLLLGRYGARAAAMQQFALDQTMTGMHTITLYAEGLQLVNGYQKQFVPWTSLFALKDTGNYLFLLCDAACDAVAINKSAVEGGLPAAFLSLLHRLHEGGSPNGTAV